MNANLFTDIFLLIIAATIGGLIVGPIFFRIGSNWALHGTITPKKSKRTFKNFYPRRQPGRLLVFPMDKAGRRKN